MKCLRVFLLAVCLAVLAVQGAGAVVFTMFSDEFNRDGGISSFATPYDFGSVQWSTTFNTSGSHNYITFIDPEIDEPENTFFNEYGDVFGTAAVGQSWEIDEPGYIFGDIYGNFLAGTLDNSNGVTVNNPDDVSMALGWDFFLDTGEIATLNFFLSSVEPASGFYLAHYDPDSQAALYFRSTLSITDGGGGPNEPIPEPSTFLLFSSALAGIGLLRLRKRG